MAGKKNLGKAAAPVTLARRDGKTPAKLAREAIVAEAVRLIASGLTWREAADKMGKSSDSLKKWCAGKVRITESARRRALSIPQELKVSVPAGKRKMVARKST